MTHPGGMRLTDFTTTDVTVEQIGTGGFGLVYMGPDRANGGKWTALKTLRPELLALQPSLRDLFVSEGLIWTGLWPHPNLLTCESATEINGRVYLQLAYASYGSLRDLLPRHSSLLLRLAWAQHIASGLLALHAPDPELLRPLPLVHRDLKLDNVLVDEHGVAQITDFGLAAAVAAALAASPQAERAFALVEHLATPGAPGAPGGMANPAGQATRTRRFQTRGASGAAGAHGGVGTIPYMPPEQWLADDAVGPAADMYAFGLLLSELLAGRHGLADLEEKRDEAGWYHLHAQGAPRPLRGGPAEGAARLPAELEALYAALLAKRPAERPSAAQALAALQRAAAALGEEPYSPPDIYPRTDEHRLVVWHNWAITCAAFERLDEALQRNERALALAPKAVNVLNAHGAILGRLGLRARQAGDEGQARLLLGAALAAHTQALAVAANDLDRTAAHAGRALQLKELGRYAEADVAIAAALALDPNHGAAWYNRANNALEWGRAEAAAGHTAEAARILAAGEDYVAEARRCGFNHPDIPRLLAVIQQARSNLKP